MKTAPYTPLDYPIVSSFYLERGLEAPPVEALPANGLVVFKEEIPIAAAFLYRTDSTIAWLDCLITSPHTVNVERQEAMRTLLEELELKAKSLGYQILVAAPSHQNVGPFLESHGYIADPKPTTLYARRL